MNASPQAPLTAGVRPSLSTFWPCIALCIFPLIAVALVLWIERVKGPYWLGGNSDPDYAYLLNALSLAIAKMPALSEHPGTTVQAFGALILRAAHLFAGSADIVDDVLSRPEFYLRAINLAVLFLFAACQFAVGAAARRMGYALTDCMLLQIGPLASLTNIQTLTCVKPEALLQPIGALLALVLVATLAGNAFVQPFQALAFGALAGAGVATKFTFLPLLFIPLIVLKSWRARSVFLGAFVVTACILLLPIYKIWPHMIASLWDIASHTGTLGAGAQGFIDTAAYAGNLGQLLREEWVAALIMAASAAAWFARLFLPEKNPVPAGAASKAVVSGGLILAQTVQFLMVAKHPGRHYLEPALSLMGLNVFLLAQWGRSTARTRWADIPAWCTMVALSVFQIASTAAHAADVDSMRLAQLKTVAFQQRQGTAKVFYHYRSSSLESALAFGDGYSGGRFGRDLQRLYPRALFYSLWHKRYYNFNTDFPAEVVYKWAASEPVFLQGSPFEGAAASYAPAHIALERVSEPGPEVLYRMRVPQGK